MRTSRVVNRIAGIARRGFPPSRVAAALAGVALALIGCGDRNLVLNVDVLSYVDAAREGAAFGPIPALPGGIVTGEQSFTPDVDVNLVDNLGNIAAVRSVSLQVHTVCEDESGSGTDTLRLYLSDADTDPRTTPPVLVQALVMQPGITDTTRSDIAGDARVLDLFSKRRMRLAVTTSYRGPSSGASLVGRVALSKLDAVVVTGRKGT